MAEGVCLVKFTDGTIAYANRKFATMFGYEEGELEGQSMAILYFNENQDAKSRACEIMAHIRSEGSYSFEIYNVKKDGTPFWCRATASTFEHSQFGAVIVAVQQDITEQKERELALQKAEKDLADSELRYRALVENAYDPILVVDSCGSIALVNAQLCKTFGYKPEELIGHSVEVLLPVGLRNHHVQLREKFMREGRSRKMGDGVNLQAQTKDGRRIPVDISLSPFNGPNGRQVTAIIRDMTEQRHREDQKALLAELAKILTDTLDYEIRVQRLADAISEKMADVCLIRLIDNGELKFKAISYQPNSNGEVIEKVIRDGIVAYGMFSSTEALVTRKTVLVTDSESMVLNNDKSGADLKRIVRDGGIKSYLHIPLMVSGSPIGVLTLMMTKSGRSFAQDDVAFGDIVGNRFAIALDNARLYQQAKRAKIVTDNMPAMIAYWDKSQRLRFANRVYKNWFGDPEALVGLHMKTVLGPALYEKNRPYVEGVLKGEAQTFERDLVLKTTGELRHTHAMYLPDIENGVVEGFFVFVTDVTELKRARQLALTGMQRAIAAVRTREQVLSIVSHDLKNPLAAICLATDALRQMKVIDTDRVIAFADRIRRATDQMQTLIADLLDYATLKSGTFSLNKARVPVRPMLELALENAKPFADEKGIELKLECDAVERAITCDAKRIGQVLSNLLGNAIKFTPLNGTVILSALLQSGGVHISVTDTGRGIQPENLEKVFDQFWQDSSCKDLGSGLGLSIAKGIISSHGGKIWVENVPGMGARFSFWLPEVTDVRSISNSI